MRRRTYDHRAEQRADERRAAALRVRCPKCNARAGAGCWSRASAGVASLHEERYESAEGGQE